MKRWVKAIVCVALFFMCLFVGVGYAAVSDTLTIHGKVNVTVPEGLFIVDVSVNASSNVDRNEYEYLPYSTTMDTNISRRSSTGSVTYRITVLNNTKRTYAYRGIYYQNPLTGYNGQGNIRENNGNNYIGVTTNFPNGNKVAPGDTLTFYATYTIGSRLNANTNWRTLINFQFGINVDSIEEAREAIFEKFLNILNSPTTYKTLCDRIDDKFSGAEWTSNYIGNVKDSTSDDSATVNELFAGQLQMTIDGEPNPITVLIKHENIDNNRKTGDDYTAVNGNQSFTGYGCEFTLYMTTSDLSNRNVKPPVYAAVFTCDRNEDGSCGQWYMVGEPYYGTAQIVGYEGGASTGSFDTGTWRSYADVYNPSETYSYSIPADQTIQQVVQAVDQNAIKALQDLLIRAKKILDENIYAGTGMEALEDTYFAYMAASKLFTVDESGVITVLPTATRVQIVPHIIELSRVLKAFDNVQ